MIQPPGTVAATDPLPLVPACAGAKSHCGFPARGQGPHPKSGFMPKRCMEEVSAPLVCHHHPADLQTSCAGHPARRVLEWRLPAVLDHVDVQAVAYRKRRGRVAASALVGRFRGHQADPVRHGRGCPRGLSRGRASCSQSWAHAFKRHRSIASSSGLAFRCEHRQSSLIFCGIYRGIFWSPARYLMVEMDASGCVTQPPNVAARIEGPVLVLSVVFCDSMDGRHILFVVL